MAKRQAVRATTEEIETAEQVAFSAAKKISADSAQRRALRRAVVRVTGTGAGVGGGGERQILEKGGA